MTDTPEAIAARIITPLRQHRPSYFEPLLDTAEREIAASLTHLTQLCEELRSDRRCVARDMQTEIERLRKELQEEAK